MKVTPIDRDYGGGQFNRCPEGKTIPMRAFEDVNSF